MIDTFLTTEEAAEYAKVTPCTIRNWIKKGYLGDCGNNVGKGLGNGYKIRKSMLSKYVNGWEIKEPSPSVKPVTKTSNIIPVEVEQLDKLMVDKESMRLAASNLRIAINFAEEELKKIEALL